MCAVDNSKYTLQIRILSATYVIVLEELTTDALYRQISELVRLRTLQSQRFYAFYSEKPLLRGRLLCDYNIPNYASIKVEFPMLVGGASKVRLPTYQIVMECENMVLNTTRTGCIDVTEDDIDDDDYWDLVMNRSDDTFANLLDEFDSGDNLTRTMQCILQANEYSDAYSRGSNIIMKRWEAFLMSRSPAIRKWIEENPISGGIENIILITHFYKKCNTFDEYVMLIRLGYKLITGKALYAELMKKFFPGDVDNLQAGFAEGVSMLRESFDNIKNISQCALAQKLSKMYAFMVAQGFLKGLNTSMTESEFFMFEKAYMKKDLTQFNMITHAIDLAIFICEKIVVYRATGEISAFVHDSSSYTKWLEEADKLLALAPFTGNLTAHGTTYFTFLSELNDTIEKGEAITKYLARNSSAESIAIKRKLASLRLIKNSEVTKKSAAKERRAPFGVLVYGSSSVAKSSFTKMLFYYYGSLHKLEKDDQYRYVRSPTSEFWTNFDSSKWCIQLDDIAFLLPTAAQGIDPTLAELLNVVNNVPYVPPQAALEDKGKTPVLARLCIATSNTGDLNAHEYFHCPLAVRRRLPYIVNVVPKKEYLHENGRFIDPLKIPLEHDGYPNLWEITVQKLVPVQNSNRDWAILENVAQFSEVDEFLKHYGEASMQHERNQDKGMECDQYMKDLDVCTLCYQVTGKCSCQLQVGEELHHSERTVFLVETFVGFLIPIFVWLYQWSFIRWQVDAFVRRQVARTILARAVVPLMDEFHQIRFLGWMSSLKDNFKKHYKKVVVISAVGMLLTTFFQVYKPFASQRKRVPDDDDEDLAPEEWKEVNVTHNGKVYSIYEQALSGSSNTVRDLEPQGNVYGTTEKQLLKEETQNVWYNPTVELTRFDIPVSSGSLVGKTVYELRDVFQRNCVRLDFHVLSTGRKARTSGVMLVGQICLFNKHVVAEDDEFEVTVIQTSPSKGISSNIKFRVSKADMRSDKERDLCIMEIKSIPPFKDILKFWLESDINITRLCMLKRQDDATMRVLDIHGVARHESFPIEALNISMPVFIGLSEYETQPGDCGSLAIGMTPRGPVLCGMHTIGYRKNLGVPIVLKERLETLKNSLVKPQFVVQGGGAPLLGLQNEIELVTPHHKSLVRYIDHGTANVYGTIPGFLPKPKSKVRKTPLCDEMCTHFSKGVQHGPPEMRGWEPWRKNVIEMVQPVVKHDRQILNKCVASFLEDILRELPAEWEKELVFLSFRAAVNGLPGVKFIDKLNTNSSMGFPWNKTKKSFLVCDPDEEYPEGVTFSEEVWERVAHVMLKYANGERAFPVFTGHLKDEATALLKILMKKTRLFTGGPVDWSIAVRSRLLSFVRLLQKNKYVFEAGPGLVAQSTEWGEVRDYLTAFGEDQIVAGDYSKFDKHMISDFVLAAFEIICGVHEAAGFTPEEVREIYCIGNDIAFPLVNVKGDLIEFFGTNPSGHPLTVVVNSLVNSLYVRYAYAVQGGDLGTFRQQVHLFTYGDDNVMGISRNIPWFNHTSIQKSLETIGVTYTMADKDSESKPYININDTSFLKRQWRYDEDVGAYLAPLDIESIHRSLTMWVPSGTINEYEQMIAVIVSANNEFFFYGKEVFIKHNEFFRGILQREPYNMYITDSTLPSWQDLYDRFWRASGKPDQA